MVHKLEEELKKSPAKNTGQTRGHSPATHHSTTQSNNDSNNSYDISSISSSGNEKEIAERDTIIRSKWYEPSTDARNIRSGRKIIEPPRTKYIPRNKTNKPLK